MAQLAWSTSTILKRGLPFALCVSFYFNAIRFLHYHQPDQRSSRKAYIHDIIEIGWICRQSPSV
jgi:hypothetical protein